MFAQSYSKTKQRLAENQSLWGDEDKFNLAETLTQLLQTCWAASYP